MSDYTPTTEQVREAFAVHGAWKATPTRGSKVSNEAFDRWLAEVKAAAWDECVEAVAWARNYGSPGGLDALRYVATNNPHRTP